MAVFLFIFGLAIFLFSMHSLEAGIRLASGQGLKNWIVKKTNTPLSSAGCGVVVTAILQSSSMVSLVVLAFVSAGVIPLYNGIGVVLGANLGTTMTGWVVTVIGFKMNLQALVVPLLGIGSVCSLGYFKSTRVAGVGKALFGFGLLVFGLDVMKDSVTNLSEIYDISALAGMPPWVYLLSGVFLAAVMQSSSAVMIITLSLLSSNLIGLSDAAAVVIGADLGTTSTTILGSLGESIIKKQLAFAHVFFNFSVNSMAFFIILPALPGALNWLAINDAMFGLVAFHSVFNLAGVLVFLPFLKHYTRWVQKVFKAKPSIREKYFSVPVEVPEAAINSLVAALNHLSSDAIHLNLLELQLSPDQVGLNITLPSSPHGSFEEQYENLKSFEGDLVRYASKLQLSSLNEEQGSLVSQLLESARSIVYACKTLKDVRIDIQQLSQSAENSPGELLAHSHRDFLVHFYCEYVPLIFSKHDAEYISEQLDLLREFNSKHHEVANTLVSQNPPKNPKATMQISTWFNLNHELHHYVRYMLSAVIGFQHPNSKRHSQDNFPVLEGP